MLQLGMTTVAMIGVCMARPHTHGGRAAPECATHLQQSPRPVSENPHAHHAEALHETGPDTRRMTCRCSSDPLSFLVGDVGVIPDRIAARFLSPARSTIAAFTSGTNDVRIPPLSPPPRAILS
jgi:hypothetical protein